MADTILGLPSSQKFLAEDDRFLNHRRKILKFYPQGGAPLTGLLSMTPEEMTNDAIFIWYEKHYASPVTTLRGTAPVTSTAPSTGDADDGTDVGAGARAITVDLYMKVASTKDFKVGHIFEFDSNNVQGYVIGVTRGVSSDIANGYITFRLQRAYTVPATPSSGVFAASTRVRIIGSAYGEGASGTGKTATGFKRPFAIQNQTEIFSDIFTFPGSVLKMGLKYDKTGPYQEKAQDTIIDHMTSLERSLIWGQRSTTLRASFDTSQEDLTVRTMSGIIEFLRLWDAGSTGIAIDGSTYAPYAFKSQSTNDDDDLKRIITNASGTITVNKMHSWAERVGRFHHNRSNEKLVLCGSKALLAANEMFRKNSVFQVRYGEKAYGLTLTTWLTPFGEFHFVTHPLFTEDPVFTYWMLFLDIHSMKYRPLTDRDTRLLRMRQNNGDDFRKDEYLTEAGLEFWAPRNNMLVQNVQQYVES